MTTPQRLRSLAIGLAAAPIICVGLLAALAQPSHAGAPAASSGAGFTPRDTLASLFELEGGSPYSTPYDGTLNFSAFTSKHATPNGHGYRNELKISRASRLPIEQTHEHFSALVTPTLPAGARTIVAQYHVEGIETIVKLYVQDIAEPALLDGKANNGVFDVVARIRDTSGKDVSTALGTVRSGERFALDVRFDGGNARVSVKSDRHGALQTPLTRVMGDHRKIYFKFGDYLQARDPDTGAMSTKPATWDAYFQRNGIGSSLISFSETKFERK
ncbi:polysaccharide lyase family 7 protein [Massilia sp. IC2-477]|uniref:polysaccharide lyase family 7 protein n=1 Tax=Massilia sp. IC2-477 TaxID=2887198 RepID=UPI001D1036CB|nr:polysaccharide lyase family 7 protein [Massilia sp. IC2-477]MCC2956764.1 polysaccharide lyase family 7 protein [Massilia sp. IC2-477]